MGCATSKQKLCDQCQRPYSPVVARSYSMHVHHPPQSHGDSYHVVALTSSTLGSLNALQIDDKISGHTDTFVDDDKDMKVKEFSIGLLEAKAWSDMINEKIPKIIPKTPIMTPPGEPETINAWELMEGLEDVSPLASSHRFRSFSFDVGKCHIPESVTSRKSNGVDDQPSSPKPMWLQMADQDSNSQPTVPEFDPDVISDFRKKMEDLPPENPFHLRPLENPKHTEIADPDSNSIIIPDSDHLQTKKSKKKEKVVLYFTSLRGVRKTYEECCNVKMILKSMGVRVDERDVSMHSGFKEELRELLGKAGINGGGLPRVFVEKKYIGGADEIRRLHEDGHLEKLLESCEKEEDRSERGERGACVACGDIRFVPCKTCSGSCKVYYEGDDNSTEEEDEYEDEEEKEEEERTEEDGSEEEEEEYGFKRCPDCNENGLIRCPICCD